MNGKIMQHRWITTLICIMSCVFIHWWNDVVRCELLSCIAILWGRNIYVEDSPSSLLGMLSQWIAAHVNWHASLCLNPFILAWHYSNALWGGTRWVVAGILIYMFASTLHIRLHYPMSLYIVGYENIYIIACISFKYARSFYIVNILYLFDN